MEQIDDDGESAELGDKQSDNETPDADDTELLVDNNDLEDECVGKGGNALGGATADEDDD